MVSKNENSEENKEHLDWWEKQSESLQGRELNPAGCDEKQDLINLTQEFFTLGDISVPAVNTLGAFYFDSLIAGGFGEDIASDFQKLIKYFEKVRDKKSLNPPPWVWRILAFLIIGLELQKDSNQIFSVDRTILNDEYIIKYIKSQVAEMGGDKFYIKATLTWASVISYLTGGGRSPFQNESEKAETMTPAEKSVTDTKPVSFFRSIRMWILRMFYNIRWQRRRRF